jgi:hypothetical protein
VRRLIIFIAAASLVCGCTIAPKITEPAQVSPWAQANILGHDLHGYTVGPDWPRVYRGMIAAYGSKLPVNEQVPPDDMTGIEPRGQNFHVDFAANKRFTDLKYIENRPGP